MDERSMEGWMVLCGLANQAHTHPSSTNGNMICNLAQPPPNDEERYLAWAMTARRKNARLSNISGPSRPGCTTVPDHSDMD